VDAVLHAALTLISLAFLGILGLVAGVAIPGLFIVVVARWLDRLAPVRDADTR